MRTVLALLAAAAALAAQQYRAFWADAFHAGAKTPAQIDQMLDDLSTAKANAVIAQMRPRGNWLYPHPVEPFYSDSQYVPGFDALQYLVERAHARGIEAHAWANVTSIGTSSDPRHLTAAHGPSAPPAEMWMTVSSAGRISPSSIDLGHPDALRYTADVILDAARYDLDGIHMDYVRYPEDAAYGWNPVAVERFQRLWNRTGNPDARDPAWAEFRRTQVTQFVRQLYLRAFAIRPSIKISAASITWGSGPADDAGYRRLDAYSRVFQDWRGWLEEGILDFAVPMNYFRESGNYIPMFDRWIEYEKNRQYGRGIVIGPAIYLNPIESSLAQLRRALAPSAAGNTPLGVSFYSYAVASSDAPPRSADFYRAVGEFFGEPVKPPVLPWKAAPERGHLYGWLEVEGGPAWLKDGATVRIESDTGGPARETLTDGTGFFGAVDLPPDRYRVRLERGGVELYRATPQDVRAGGIARFDLRLKAEDFAGVIPSVAGAPRAVSPGGLITITGRGFAPEPAWAAAVPLPAELGRTQVLVNGEAAPLFSVAPDRIELQAPYLNAERWSIVVRHAGMESAAYEVPYAPATPVILGAGRHGAYLEINGTGLGAIDPPLAAGIGGNASEPLNRTVFPVTALFDGLEVPASYAGLAPWAVGRYQVNVLIPDGFTSGEVRLKAAGEVSSAFRVSFQ